jgi:aryl-alcohol dehydrogenase-like predicted oxidoreductase
MEYVNLGRSGLKVSRICLGCMSFGNDAVWKVELDQARKLVERALDLGINFFDTANVYSLGRSEEILGECLKGRRDDVVIATKVYSSMGQGPNDSGLSRRHIMDQIRASLLRLGTDHVDLYQTHRWDYNTPIEETMRALDDTVHFGLTHYVGASSMFAWQFLKALHTSDRLNLTRFVSMQNHYNLLYREEEREMIPLCKEEGIAIIPWSPLARGFLTGKYKRNETPKSLRYQSDKFLPERYFKSEDFEIVETAEAMGRQKGATPGQIALSWLLHNGVTSPIIGATKVEHVEEAVGSLAVKLDAQDVNRLEASYRPHPVLGHV